MSGWPVSRWRSQGAPRRVLSEDFQIEVNGVQLKVPAGFDDFDGASIPRWLWTSVGHPLMREFERAALVHDYLYAAPEARRRYGVDSRAQIDALFYEILLLDGVEPAKAKRMRWGVERFGESRYTHSGPGYVAKTRAELEALEKADCDCAEDEIKAMVEAGEGDPELLRSFREIDWGVIKHLF